MNMLNNQLKGVVVKSHTLNACTLTLLIDVDC